MCSCAAVTTDGLPQDLVSAHATIPAERAAHQEEASLRLEIARLKRARFGSSAERSVRLEQLELALEDLAEMATIKSGLDFSG